MGTTGTGREQVEQEIALLLAEGASGVLRFLQSRVDVPADAEELTQEVLLRAFVALRRGVWPERRDAWLTGIARNVLLETWRAERSRQRLEQRQAREMLAMGPAWDGLTGSNELDRRLIVGEAVDDLPVDLRVAVLLHYFGGLPIAQVATHLGVAPGAVNMRLLRARLALRAQLAETAWSDKSDDEGEIAMTVSNALRGGSRGGRAPDVASRLAQSDSSRYSSLDVALEVGGVRGATDPFSVPVFSGGALSIAQLQLAMDRLRAARLAGSVPLSDRITFWPAPDPFNHEDPAAAWSLLTESPGKEGSRLVPTDGWRLGTDPEWRSLLQRFKDAGVRHVWFTLVGLCETHDELSGKRGAFAAVITAMERCTSVGLETGANVVVSTRSTNQLGELSRLVRRLGAERFVPTYPLWWSRGSESYEVIRPEPGDLAGQPPADLDANWGHKEFWQDPAQHTESAFVRGLLNGTGDTVQPQPTAPPKRPSLGLTVDAELNVHVGEWWGQVQQRVANLEVDTPAEVHRKLLTLEPQPSPPPDAVLAERFGEADSQKVYARLDSVRRKWLAAWMDAGETL